jgi:hypothetical protein
MGQVECPLQVDVENCSWNSLGIHWLQVEGLLRVEQEQEQDDCREMLLFELQSCLLRPEAQCFFKDF